MLNDYQKALDTARNELDGLLRQKAEMDKRIAKLRQTVASLAAMCEESGDAEGDDDRVRIPGAVDGLARNIALATQAMYGRTIGFTDAVREVLKASGGKFMSPLEVKDGLLRMGVDLESKYTNPLAVIHRTLKRLYESGAVRMKNADDGSGGSVYAWKTTAVPLPPPPERLPTFNTPNTTSKDAANVPLSPPPPKPSPTTTASGIRPRHAQDALRKAAMDAIEKKK